MNHKRILSLLLCFFLLCAGAAFAESETATESALPAESASPAGGITSIDELAGGTVGVQTGMICDTLTQQRVPNVKINYYNSQTDALIALQNGKVDGWCCDEPVARYMTLSHSDLVILDEKMADSELAAVFPKTDKGQKLRDQYSAFVDGLWKDGTMKEIDALWFSTDENKRTVFDYTALPDTNGTLRMAVDSTFRLSHLSRTDGW